MALNIYNNFWILFIVYSIFSIHNRFNSSEIIIVILGWPQAKSKEPILLSTVYFLPNVFIFSIFNRISTSLEIVFWLIGYCPLLRFFNFELSSIDSFFLTFTISHLLFFSLIRYWLFSCDVVWIIESWLWLE